MNFGFTEEQELLRAELRKFLDQNCPLDEVRKLAESQEGFSRSFWERMGELGWLGLTIGEEGGGVGLGWVDLVVVLEETGRSLYPSPIVATTLAAHAIQAVGSEEQRATWLPQLASGAKIGTVALQDGDDIPTPAGVTLRGEREGDATLLSGEKPFVLDAGSADVTVVAFREGDGEDEIGLALVERGAPGVAARETGCIDATHRQGCLTLDGVRITAAERLGAPGGAGPVVQELFDRGAIAVTAEAIGAAEAALELTAGYAKQRVQFGERIGRFQGVKHPLADWFVDIESWKSLLYFAAWALDESPEEAPLAVSRAKAYASEAFARIGVEAVGLHGAIGYTWEYDAHLFLKRAKWTRAWFGDADHHYERVAALGGL